MTHPPASTPIPIILPSVQSGWIPEFCPFYRLTALMVESYIDYIIRNNPEDFKQVSFIGTPYYYEK